MNRQHIKHGQKIIHDLNKPIQGRLKSRRVVGPYIVTPQRAGKDRVYSFYLDSDFMPSLRWTYAHDIVELDHTGWYSDNDGIGDLIKGIVMRLPHNRGFLAGWTMGQGMISEVDATIYCEREAAYAADSLANYTAEKSRDEDAKFQADQDIKQAREEISEECEHVHKLVLELRGFKKLPETICNTIRADIRSSMYSVKQNIRIINARKENYWTSIHGR